MTNLTKSDTQRKPSDGANPDNQQGDITAVGGEVNIPIGRIGIHLRREAETISKLLAEVIGVDDPASSTALSHAESRLRHLIATIELVFDIEEEDSL